MRLHTLRSAPDSVSPRNTAYGLSESLPADSMTGIPLVGGHPGGCLESLGTSGSSGARRSASVRDSGSWPSSTDNSRVITRLPASGGVGADSRDPHLPISTDHRLSLTLAHVARARGERADRARPAHSADLRKSTANDSQGGRRPYARCLSLLLDGTTCSDAFGAVLPSRGCGRRSGPAAQEALRTR